MIQAPWTSVCKRVMDYLAAGPASLLVPVHSHTPSRSFSVPNIDLQTVLLDCTAEPIWVDCSDATLHYWMSPQESFTPDDWPCLRPPWPFFILWSRAPEELNGDRGIHPWPWTGLRDYALACWAIDRGEEIDIACKLFLPRDSFAGLGNFPIDGSITVDRQGNHLRRGPAICSGLDAAWMELQRLRGHDLTPVLGVLFDSLMIALSFLNCRNITTQEHQGPRRSKAERRHPKGPDHWKTLVIRPTNRRGQTDSGYGQEDGLVPLHLVRGHFKTFTSAAPLLGRHVGTYWWSPMVRGSELAGRVHKNYEVRA